MDNPRATESALYNAVLDAIADAKTTAVANELAGLGHDAAVADQARIAGMLDLAVALGYDRAGTDRYASIRAQRRAQG